MIYAIAIGAALGGVLRFWLEAMSKQITGKAYPYGTMAANFLGSFALGALNSSAFVSAEGLPIQALIAFTGAFTTFGGFIAQGMLMIKAGVWQRGVVYLSVTVAGSIAAAWLGLQI